MDRYMKNYERLQHQIGKTMTVVSKDGKFNQLLNAAAQLSHTKFLCNPDDNYIQILLTKDTDSSVFNFVDDQKVLKIYNSVTIK